MAPGAPAGPVGSESFGSAPQAADAFGAAPPPKKKGMVGKVIGGVLGAVVLLCVVGGFLVYRFVIADNTKAATAGSCLADLPDVAEGENKEANDAKVVECTDPIAAYKVEGRYEDKTEGEAETACAAHPTAEFFYTAIPTGGRGYVLCLSQVQK